MTPNSETENFLSLMSDGTPDEAELMPHQLANKVCGPLTISDSTAWCKIYLAAMATSWSPGTFLIAHKAQEWFTAADKDTKFAIAYALNIQNFANAGEALVKYAGLLDALGVED